MGAMSLSSGRDLSLAFTVPDRSILLKRRKVLEMNDEGSSSDVDMAVSGGKPASCNSFLCNGKLMRGQVIAFR